jgi:hypothetical protein
MTTLQKGLTIALRNIDGKLKHEDYDHVVDLSQKLYKPLITGKDIGHLLQRFTRREDDAAYQQRLRLTQVITPAIHNTIMGPLRKLPAVKPVTDRADFGTEAKTDNEELRRMVQNFYNGKSVDHFLGSVLLDQGAIDPNAFCLVTFDKFDPRTEKPTVYPTIVSSTDAWNFEIVNGDLRWLLVHRPMKYNARKEPDAKTKAPGKATGKAPEMVMMDGNWFCMYLRDHQVEFIQTDPANAPTSMESVLVDAKGKPVPEDASGVKFDTEKAYFYRVSKVELYEVRFFEQKSGEVQAFRIGYIADPVTSGRTCVNFWHAALPYMLKGIKAGSELDITAALHAFLQKIQYANPCKGHTDVDGRKWDCLNGFEQGTSRKCQQCGGSGWDVISSAQDHMTLRLPRTKEEFLELANLVHYVQLPVEVLNWQDGYVDKLEAKCYRAVYNTERFRQDQLQSTATGELIDMQSVYDAIRPAVDWWSMVRMKVYRLTATFGIGSDKAKKLELAHQFPRNLRFETTNDMVALRKAMKEAGLSGAMLMQVDSDLIEHLYVDDERALKRAKCMLSFDPFAGKEEGTCLQLISQDRTTQDLAVLWTNMGYVFREAEERAGADNLDFYELTRDKQQEIIDAIVAEIVDELDAAAAEANAARPTLGVAGDAGGNGGAGNGDPNPNDPPADPPSGQ